MTEHLTRVNGIELCHETFGDAAGRPLLLVMGPGAPMIRWDDVVPGMGHDLPARSCRA